MRGRDVDELDDDSLLVEELELDVTNEELDVLEDDFDFVGLLVGEDELSDVSHGVVVLEEWCWYEEVELGIVVVLLSEAHCADSWISMANHTAKIRISILRYFSQPCLSLGAQATVDNELKTFPQSTKKWRLRNIWKPKFKSSSISRTPDHLLTTTPPSDCQDLLSFIVHEAYIETCITVQDNNFPASVVG